MAIRATISVGSIEASQLLFRNLAPDTHYCSAEASEIWVDPDSKNRFVGDEQALGDLEFWHLSRSIDSHYTIADRQWKGVRLPKGDDAALDDLFERVVAYVRHFHSAFGLDDWNRINKDYLGSKGNIFGFSDDEFRSFVKGVAEDLPLFSEQRKELKKIFSDLAAVESLHGLDLTRPLDDLFGVEDQSYRHPLKREDDSLSIGSECLRDITKGVEDQVPLGSTVGWRQHKPLDGVLGATDLNSLNYQKSISDSIVLESIVGKQLFVVQADAFVAQTSYFLLARLVEVFDTLKVDDFITTGVLSDAVADTTLNEYLLNESLFNGAISTAFSISPLIQRIGFPEEGIDPLGVTDQFSRSSQFFRGWDNSIGVEDDPSITTQWSRPQSDPLTVSDQFWRQIQKPHDDGVLVADQIDKQIGFQFASAVAVDDLVGVGLPEIYKEYQGDKNNITLVSDHFERTTGWVREFVDSSAIEDHPALQFRHPVSGDILGFSDSVDIELIGTASMLNAFSLNEAILNQ